MAFEINRIELIGRLGADVTVNHLASGGRVANLSIATDEPFIDKTGQRVDRTEWHRVVTFQDGLIAMLERHAKKGRLVHAEGKLQTRRWKKDGEDSDRFSTEILVVPRPPAEVPRQAERERRRRRFRQHRRSPVLTRSLPLPARAAAQSPWRLRSAALAGDDSPVNIAARFWPFGPRSGCLVTPERTGGAGCARAAKACDGLRYSALVDDMGQPAQRGASVCLRDYTDCRSRAQLRSCRQPDGSHHNPRGIV